MIQENNLRICELFNPKDNFYRKVTRSRGWDIVEHIISVPTGHEDEFIKEVVELYLGIDDRLGTLHKVLTQKEYDSMVELGMPLKSSYWRTKQSL